MLRCAVLLQVHSLKLALEGVEKERDFYFGKLREIELLCQEHGQENDDLVQRLMEVLYASEDHVSPKPFFPRHSSCNMSKIQIGSCCTEDKEDLMGMMTDTNV